MKTDYLRVATCVTFALCIVHVGLAAESPAIGAGYLGDAQSTTGPVAPAGIFRGYDSGLLAVEQGRGGGTTTRTVTGVPAFLWYRGCGPTAAAMVLAYWDSQGFADLFPGDASARPPW